MVAVQFSPDDTEVLGLSEHLRDALWRVDSAAMRVRSALLT